MTSILLVVGRGDSDYSNRNPRRLVAHSRAAGWDVKWCDYHEVERLGDCSGDAIVVMLFFPYTFWNEHCEVPGDPTLYGADRRVFTLLDDFLRERGAALRSRFAGRQLDFVIQPETAALDRDKLETLRRLAGQGVPTSQVVEPRDADELLSHVLPERGVMIKSRYGAEGKGITLITSMRWLTNYRVEGSRLGNHGVHDRWPMVEITGRRDLLEQLLVHDVVAELEILPPSHAGGEKFDCRVYVTQGRAVHLLARFNAHSHVVTNYSQGGTIRHHPETGLPEDAVAAAGATAAKAARALDSRFVGVDLMFDRSFATPRVIETQCFTDFPSIERFDLARHLSRELGAPTDHRPENETTNAAYQSCADAGHCPAPRDVSAGRARADAATRP